MWEFREAIPPTEAPPTGSLGIYGLSKSKNP